MYLVFLSRVFSCYCQRVLSERIVMWLWWQAGISHCSASQPSAALTQSGLIALTVLLGCRVHWRWLKTISKQWRELAVFPLWTAHPNSQRLRFARWCPFPVKKCFPLQNLSWVGISTLELPVMLSFQQDQSVAAAGSMATLTWPLYFWSWFHQNPVLCCSAPCCWAAACACDFIPLQCSLLGQCLAPECPAALGLFVALQAHPQARAQLALGRNWDRMNWFRSILQEKSNRKTVTVHRAKTSSLTHHPHFGVVLAFLSLLGIWSYFLYLLFSFFINLSLTSLSTAVFWSSFLQVAIWWFEFRSKNNEATRQPG